MADRDGAGERPAFTSWEVERVRSPKRFDNYRLDQVPIRERRHPQPATSPELAWNARRRHAPCHTRVPPACNVDCHFLRLDEELEYVIRLAHILTVPTSFSLDRASWALLPMAPPYAPFRWPSLPRPTPFPRQEFAAEGVIAVPGESCARDSAYALYKASLAAGAGDPGRFIAEYRKESRLRTKGLLVAWTQVEFHQIFPGDRAALYPEVPREWGEWEVPTAMKAPLPPSLAYAGSYLIRGDRLVWAIFFTEWTILVFGRWVADAVHRGLLWRLPQRVLNGIYDLGLSELLRGSKVSVRDVEELLGLHARVDWSGIRPSFRRIGAIPITVINGEIAPLADMLVPEMGSTRADDDEEIVAAGRWDEEILGRGVFPEMEGIGMSVDPRMPRKDVVPGPTLAGGTTPRHSQLGNMSIPRTPAQPTSNLQLVSGPTQGIAPTVEKSLNVHRIEEWMWRMNIHRALDSYFPSEGLNEEDIARAYSLLLVERDQARTRMSAVECELREERLDRRHLVVFRDRAADHLRQVQDDLSELMGRLSVKGETGNRGSASQESAGFGKEDERSWEGDQE